jgi:uncharacterized membrane protein YfcA
MLAHWFVLLLAGTIAGTVSGALGFGGAMLLLPVLTIAVGARAAVPILTVAQLCGNLSRAGFGWHLIRWRPALLFSLGAVPASIVGAWLFVGLQPAFIARVIGVSLLGIVAVRHTKFGRDPMPEGVMALAGAGVGFVSSVAGSAGPLGGAVFLSLHLPPQAYVATEAVSAVLMHLTKSLVYGRHAVLTIGDVVQGLILGAALVAGSWMGRKLIGRIPERRFALLVEALLVLSAVALFVGTF